MTIVKIPLARRGAINPLLKIKQMDITIIVHGKTGLETLIGHRLDDDLCEDETTPCKKQSRYKNSFKFDQHALLFIEWINDSF